jgi:hypothetical protein
MGDLESTESTMHSRPKQIESFERKPSAETESAQSVDDESITERNSEKGSPSVQTWTTPVECAARQQNYDLVETSRAFRVSSTGIVVLAIGTASTCMAMALLVFLWDGGTRAARGQGTSSAWQQLVMMNNGATRTVTVCSVIIRISTSVQVSLATSMMAALLWESGSVSLQKVPAVSVMRATAPDPIRFLLNVGRDLWNARNKMLTTAAVILFIISAGIQFSSTILLSDFTTISVPGSTSSMNATFGYLQRLRFNGVDPYNKISKGFAITQSTIVPWKTPPPAFARFAESEGGNLIRGADFEDTGPVYRSFPPFHLTNTRARLRRYEGPATVIDSRVVCVRPSLRIRRIEKLFSSEHQTWFDGISIEGVASFGRELPMLGMYANDTYEFACHVSVAIQNKSSQPKLPSISACALGLSAGIIMDPSGPHFTFEWPNWKAKSFITTALIVSTIGHNGQWSEILKSSRYWGNQTHDWNHTDGLDHDGIAWETTGEGAWFSFQAPGGTVGLNTTLCVPNLHTDYYNVVMEATADGTEPVLSGSTAGDAVFSCVENQLLTLNKKPLEHRGILSLRPQTDWSSSHLTMDDLIPWSSILFDFPFTPSYSGSHERYLPSTPSGNGSDASVVLTGSGGSSEMFPREIHRLHSLLFGSTLLATGSIAEALQVLFTTITQMTYYEFLVTAKATAPATYVLSESISAPVRWYGLAAVVSMIGMHFLSVSLVVACFLRCSRLSVIGNVWLSVAQVVSDSTMPILEETVKLGGRPDRKGLQQAQDKSEWLMQPDEAGRAILRRRPGAKG